MRRTARRLSAVAAVLVLAGCGAATRGSSSVAPTAPRTGPTVAASTHLVARVVRCTAKRPVVVLDPGHSGGPSFDSTAEVDGRRPVTAFGITFHPVAIDRSGIMAIDNGGAPGERVTMWQAALRIQRILRSAGYVVDITKSSADENVGLLERVREAIRDHATIAVSLHYTGGIPFGEASPHFGVTPQQVGLYRKNVFNGYTIRFTNRRVAAESMRDARIIQRARAAAGDRVDVAPLDESFPESRGLPAYGNISIVQVVDQRFPWIYNEDGDIGFNFGAYTSGIANGIKKAVPIASCLRPKG